MSEGSASSRIFISYRRDDSEWAVVALNDKLRDHFGDRIFKDTDNIAPGEDFASVIDQELQSCSVMLAVIGKDWLAARDARTNTRRLDDPHDTLRIEIATALRNEHVLVIPVLVRGAVMPSAGELPPDLQLLSRRNAVTLSGGTSWNSDVERLVRAIERGSRVPAVEPPQAAPKAEPLQPSDPALEPQNEAFNLIEVRRNRQIAEHVRAAREAFEAHDYEAVLEACEKAVFLAPHEPEARSLARQAQSALDETRIRTWLTDAQEVLSRKTLSDSDLAGASDLIDRALALNQAHQSAVKLRQDVLGLRQQRERQREADRHVRAAIARAQRSLEEEDYDAAIEHCDDALGVSTGSVEVQELRDRAVAARDEERRRREHRRRAQQAIREASAAEPLGANRPDAEAAEVIDRESRPPDVPAALPPLIAVDSPSATTAQASAPHQSTAAGPANASRSGGRSWKTFAAVSAVLIGIVAIAGAVRWRSDGSRQPGDAAGERPQALTPTPPAAKPVVFKLAATELNGAALEPLSGDCDLGHAAACTELGRRYFYGRGVVKDDTRSFSYHQRGCEGGDAQACHHWGNMHTSGWGIAQDLTKAASLQQRACEGGSMDGCRSWGVAYEMGRGVEKDLARAASLYQRACEGGSMDGCRSWGVAYEMGRGVEKDLARAASLYQRACEGGSASSCNNLGLLYRRGMGVAADLSRAAGLYQRACEAGSAAGCNNWGVVHENGWGVPKSLSKAASLYQRACDANYATGCVRAGSAFWSGQGVAIDRARAVGFYQRGCAVVEGPSTAGCSRAALAYEKGDGVKRDVGRALELYRRLCQLDGETPCEAEVRLTGKAK